MNRRFASVPSSTFDSAHRTTARIPFEMEYMVFHIEYKMEPFGESFLSRSLMTVHCLVGVWWQVSLLLPVLKNRTKAPLCSPCFQIFCPFRAVLVDCFVQVVPKINITRIETVSSFL